MAVVVDKYLDVLMTETGGVDAGVELMNGDWIQITATGTVWSGVWFTGENGPGGWGGWSASNDAVLPGSPPFSLLLSTPADGYAFVGSTLNRTYQNSTLGPGATTQLSFDINRDPSSRVGTGSFHVHLTVMR